jgi:hypothetical protein
MRARTRSILAIGLTFLLGGSSTASVLFDFNTASLHSPLPLSLTSAGITAQFTATGSGYSIQQANFLGFTPVGFSGYCLYPSSGSLSDLSITFTQSLKDVSILYAPQENATDSSCTMRITAYKGASLIGTNTHTIDPPGTWPSGTLSFSSAQAFDKVLIHYDQPPVTGGDYGPIFMADNLAVTPVPEPGSIVLLFAGLAGLVMWRRLRRA